MIPYFRQPSVSLGPVSIHAFGVLVATGILLGAKLLERRAAQHDIPQRDVGRFVAWIVVGGFIGAHLVDRFIYFPTSTLADPMSILRFWEGISSFGGFLGGTVAAFVFFHRHGAGKAWEYADSFAYAFPFAWIFGRLGCFTAFDHPGRPTSFFLGEVYADGIVRHNLGLYEALYSLVIAAAFALLGRKPRFTGFFIGSLLVAYAPFRFGLDFMRIVDARYAGLTPAQYGSIALLTLGVLVLARRLQVFRSGLLQPS